MKRLSSPVFSTFVLMVVTLVALARWMPSQTYAHPSVGITPTATNPGGGNPGGGGGGGGGDDDDNDMSVIDVSVSCTLVCPPDSTALQTSIPVQFIHNGSGWIAEATISSWGNTRVDVPYAGEWKVFMTGPPYIDTGDATIELEVPSAYPILLGVVYTNGGQQSVTCPFTPVCEELPDLLPTTGEQPLQKTLSYVYLITIISLILFISFGLVSMIHPQISNRK